MSVLVRVLIGLGAALLVGCLIAVYGFGPKDDQMIYSALEESIEASRQGKPDGVLEHLMHSFTYNGEQSPDRKQMARFIRAMKPAVVMEGRDLRIEDSQATLKSPAKVSFSNGMKAQIDRVEVVFRKETGTRWLVFPYPSWRVQSVTAPDFDPMMFMGEGLPF